MRKPYTSQQVLVSAAATANGGASSAELRDANACLMFPACEPNMSNEPIVLPMPRKFWRSPVSGESNHPSTATPTTTALVMDAWLRASRLGVSASRNADDRAPTACDDDAGESGTNSKNQRPNTVAMRQLRKLHQKIGADHTDTPYIAPTAPFPAELKYGKN